MDYILKYVVKGVDVSVGDTGDPDSNLATEWEDIEIGTDLSPFEIRNDARTSSDASWNVPSLSEFLVFLHKSRLLQPFGSFLGKSCQHHKNHLACPECGDEFYALVIRDSEKVIYNALDRLDPYAAHILSNGQVPRPVLDEKRTRRRKTNDPVGGSGSGNVRELLAVSGRSLNSLGGKYV